MRTQDYSGGIIRGSFTVTAGHSVRWHWRKSHACGIALILLLIEKDS